MITEEIKLDEYPEEYGDHEPVKKFDLDFFVSDQYKLRHAEVIYATTPDGIEISKKDISQILEKRGLVAVPIGTYHAYLAIKPKLLGKKKQTLLVYVPTHDIPMFIGKGGRNIDHVRSELALLYRKQHPSLPDDIRVSIIIKPLFIESQMVLNSKEDSYIYSFEIDMAEKSAHEDIMSFLSTHYLSPAYVSHFYKKGNYRSLFYFRGEEDSRKAYALIKDNFVIGESRRDKDPVVLYQKVRRDYQI